MSELAAYQRAIVTLAFAEDDAPRAVLPGFGLYRELIRARLFAMAHSAFAGSFACAHAALEACFARYLAEAPPATPLIRDAIEAFGPYAERALVDEAAGSDVAPALRSWLRFETAKWQVASAPYQTIHELRELDFDGVPVVNATLRRIELDCAVEDGRVELDPHALLLYRRPDDDRVLWTREPLLAALLAEAEGTLAERVMRSFERTGQAPDEDAVARIADALTLAVERGIVLGVR